MSRIFITMGSAHSKAANVNPVDGIWCSDCGWAGRVEEDILAIQSLPGTVGGRSNSGLSCASLSLRDAQMK